VKLCPTCQTVRADWLRLDYNPRQPSEWPGRQSVLDCRTTHAERRAEWRRKTDQQVQLIEDMCARQHLTHRLLLEEAA
jgi:hypothetical protein